MSNVEHLINEREKTVGNFSDQSEFIEGTLQVWMKTKNWELLAPFQKQALRMSLHKIGRILVGDPFYPDHWIDLEGYIHLVVQRLPPHHRLEAPRLVDPDGPGTPEDGGEHARMENDNDPAGHFA